MIAKPWALLLLLLAVLMEPGAVRAQQPSTVPETTLAPYRINAGDEIEVHVWGEERLQRRIRVLPDGSFSFPLVGRVVAVNKLPKEIEEIVSSRLAEQYRESVPFVTVSVLNPSGMQYTVIGKVRSPGAFSPGRYVNALEALSLAGGATEFANLDDVMIIRKVGGTLSWLPVRLADVVRGKARGQAAASIPEIQGGDTVIVP